MMRCTRLLAGLAFICGLVFGLCARAEPVEIEVRAEVRNINELFDITVERTADFARIYQSPLTDCEYRMDAYGGVMTVLDIAANETRTTNGGTRNGCRFVDSGRIQSAEVQVTCLAGTTVTFSIQTDTPPSDTVSLLPIFALTTAGGGMSGTGVASSGTVRCSPNADGIMTVRIGPRLYVRAGTSAPAGVWTGNLLFETNF